MTEEILNEPNNKTLHDKLEKQLYFHSMDATLIVMNPDTCKALWASVWTADKKRILEYDKLDSSVYITFKGIKVLRSLDLPFGLFEIR